MSRPIVNCADEEWTKAVHSHLYQGLEVDLINFDFELHGQSCELMAEAFAFEFFLGRIPQERAAHFRKKLKL